MNYKKNKQGYVLKLKKDKEVITEILLFVQKKKIKSSFIFGIGAVQNAELSFYDLQNKKYLTKKFNKPFEVSNLTGNISWVGKKPIAHIHVTLADKNLNVVAGHLNKAIVGATLEIFINIFPNKIERKNDDQIGLNLLDI
jgi:hypothetical protein